jgi:hypothetical protein
LETALPVDARIGVEDRSQCLADVATHVVSLRVGKRAGPAT